MMQPVPDLQSHCHRFHGDPWNATEPVTHEIPREFRSPKRVLLTAAIVAPHLFVEDWASVNHHHFEEVVAMEWGCETAPHRQQVSLRSLQRTHRAVLVLTVRLEWSPLPLLLR